MTSRADYLTRAELAVRYASNQEKLGNRLGAQMHLQRALKEIADYNYWVTQDAVIREQEQKREQD